MLANQLLRPAWRGLRPGSTCGYATAAEAKPSETPVSPTPAITHAKRLRRGKAVALKKGALKVLNPKLASYFKRKQSVSTTKLSKTWQKLQPLISGWPPKYDFDETQLSNQEYVDNLLGEEAITMGKVHGFIPELIAPFKPSINLIVQHSDDMQVYRGIKLPSIQVRPEPKVRYSVDEKKYFTLVMLDPDFPLRENNKQFWNHYLVTNIPGSKVDQGQVLASWVPPAPPQNTGIHRYIWLLYEQKDKQEFKNPTNQERILLDFPAFVAEHKLKPVGICFHRTEFDSDVAELYKSWGGTGTDFNAKSYQTKLQIKQKQYQSM